MFSNPIANENFFMARNTVHKKFMVYVLLLMLIFIAAYFCITIQKVSTVEEKQGLNLRTGPGKDFDKIIGIPYKAKVRIIEYSDNTDEYYGKKDKWVKVNYGHHEGWLFNAFLSGPEADGYKIRFTGIIFILLFAVLFITISFRSEVLKIVRLLLQKYDSSFGIRIRKLFKSAFDEKDEFNEKTYEIGKKFEEYVTKIISKSNGKFSIFYWNNDIHTKHKNIYVEADGWPDLIIRHEDSQVRIGIECKYRTNFFQNTNNEIEIHWAQPKQIRRYNYISRKENIPIFVFIGVGGNPSHPDYTYCIPLQVAKYPKLYQSLLNKYVRIPPDKPLYWDGTVLK